MLDAVNSLGTKYCYLDSTKKVCHEDKNKSIASIIKRSFMSLIGLRDYRLSSVLSELLSKSTFTELNTSNSELIKKTFQSLHFSSEETEVLIKLLNGDNVELPCSIDCYAFNKKLSSNPAVKMIFTAARCQDQFVQIRYISYKMSAFNNLAVGRTIDLDSVYQIDKMADFCNWLRKKEIKISLNPDCSTFQNCQKAEQLRTKIFADMHTAQQDWHADIIAYDVSTIEAEGLWDYYNIEKLYFRMKGSFVGHVAREYCSDNQAGKVAVSHMMENYELADIKLHQLFFKRYRLDLKALVNPEIKDQLLNKFENDEGKLNVYLRSSFDEISKMHIESESSGNLKKAKNSILNQISTAFRFDRSIFNKTDHYKEKTYQSSMLCSEYVQMSLINCLILLDQKLKTEFSITDKHVLNLPLDEKDKDFVSPADFFKKWSAVLSEVSTPQIVPQDP